MLLPLWTGPRGLFWLHFLGSSSHRLVFFTCVSPWLRHILWSSPFTWTSGWLRCSPQGGPALKLLPCSLHSVTHNYSVTNICQANNKSKGWMWSHCVYPWIMEDPLNLNLYIIGHSRPHALHFSFGNIPLGCLCLVFSCLLLSSSKKRKCFSPGRSWLPYVGNIVIINSVSAARAETILALNFTIQIPQQVSQRWTDTSQNLQITLCPAPTGLGFSVRPAFRKELCWSIKTILSFTLRL